MGINRKWRCRKCGAYKWAPIGNPPECGKCLVPMRSTKAMTTEDRKNIPRGTI